jgi:spermidine dehydrogenase
MKIDHLLGMDQKITRRDFLNGALIGTGSVLLSLHAPMSLFAQKQPWDGYGGVAEYASTHGNTKQVLQVAHKFIKNKPGKLDAFETGEIFDLVVIGGGLSGLGAAFHFKHAASKNLKCLVIENHQIFGGEAKRNEFIVNNQKLIGPQASNSFVVIDRKNVPGYEIYSELGLPKIFEYKKLSNKINHLQFDRTNYGFMLWLDAPSIGYFFDEKFGITPKWTSDLWRKKLSGTPFSHKIKQDFIRWKQHEFSRRNYKQWLDSMTYKTYIEKILGLNHEITKFVNPILATTMGLGCDVTSAYGAYQLGMPGFTGSSKQIMLKDSDWHSFPGGNDGISRYLIKSLIPGAIRGSNDFADIHNQAINFKALDSSGSNVRIRLGATAVNVEHNSDPEKSEFVWITYIKKGKVYRLKARTVVMASASFVNRNIIHNLPKDYKDAYKHFHYSPIMVMNVAVTNWQFLYKLGFTACRWFHGFGFACNIRQPMTVGNYKPPLDPDQPALMTFYIPFYYPGLSIHQQGVKGRNELLSHSYSDYERKVRRQMVTLFGKAGFNPTNDIAGIVLNRWGHAFVNPQPGFYFGRNGKPAPRDIIRRKFGRITFAHSELNGDQHWVGAIEEGQRAVKQILRVL